MRCEQCRELMLAYVKGELPQDQTHAVEDHVQQCVDCAGELQGARKVLGLVDAADQPPISRTLDALVEKAVAQHASDIHIEPFAGEGRVRLRVDGVLREAMPLPQQVYRPLVTRVKLLAGMSLSETGAPQDGRILHRVCEKALDLRASVVPGVRGERAVLRLLPAAAEVPSLESVGLAPADRELLESLLRAPNGIIFATGPTGSGKTTTLYAALQHLNRPHINIMTVEDPVEVVLEGVTQIPVDPRRGIGFAQAMRAILRQDPDVILCGEVRDRATADVLIQAAITGHLVLSTLHTRDAAGALRRLADMGVERFLIADSVVAVSAQRLARLLCADCKRRRPPSEGELSWLREAAPSDDLPEAVWEPVGCEKCRNTGYRGRTGFYEILVMDDDLQRAVTSEMDMAEVAALARSRMRPLRMDAARKCAQGLTSPAEALRVTSCVE